MAARWGDSDIQILSMVQYAFYHLALLYGVAAPADPGVLSLPSGDGDSGVTDLESTRGRLLAPAASFLRFLSDASDAELALRERLG